MDTISNTDVKIISEDSIYFVVNKNIFKDRLQIASSFHIDGSVWIREDKSIEIINVQDIRIKIIIPIITTNITSFPCNITFILNYDVKDNSLKNIECDNVIVIYSRENKEIKICGINNKTVRYRPNKLIESVSQIKPTVEESQDFEYSFEEDNKLFDKKELLLQEKIDECEVKVQCSFTDIYKLDTSSENFYHSINIQDYSHCIGSFVLTFVELTSFINKTYNIKTNKILFEKQHLEKSLNILSVNRISGHRNLMTLTLINNTEDFNAFELDSKYFEKLKGINVAITNNKKKDKKIYNELIFDIIKRDDEISGISVRPNNILENTKHNSQECFFIFIPVLN